MSLAQPLKVAFAGTPEFARVALQAIHDAGFEVPLVLTQPDRPAGRGMKLQASPVKQLALDSGLALAQPRSLRLDGKFADDASAARAALLAADADVLVVAAYGLILPGWVLELPRWGCLNIHGSLLPRWRGAAPVQRAIEAGDSSTGVTIMQMDAGLDTGDMLLAEAVRIEAADTSASLTERLAALGARLIVRSLQLLAAGALARQPQTPQGVTYAHKIAKAESAIDWHASAALIERRLRAFDPFPGASFSVGDEAAKLWRAAVVESGAAPQAAPGTVIALDDTRLIVACGERALSVLEVQRAGARRLPVEQFLRTHPGATIRLGQVLPSAVSSASA
jgi:methionyl-tRNA formyltransferase